jgi:hypothetical protein
MQQMIPHHKNAINMAKLLLKQVPAADITAAMEEDKLTNILYDIISVQSYQVHQFRNYLGPLGLLPSEVSASPTAAATTASATTAAATTAAATTAAPATGSVETESAASLVVFAFWGLALNI